MICSILASHNVGELELLRLCYGRTFPRVSPSKRDGHQPNSTDVYSVDLLQGFLCSDF